MTRLIVNDASCLIDLRKGRLLCATLRLPYRFVVPLPIRHSEVRDLSESEWARLETDGLETFDLSPDLIEEAQTTMQAFGGLSLNDCLCLVTARRQNNVIRLTGDRLLRRAAEAEGLCVHGVLWIIDQLQVAGICDNNRLVVALEIWRDDPSVFLPESEINRRIELLTSNEGARR